MRIQGSKSNAFLPLAIQLHQYFHALARFQPLRWICNHFSVIIGDWEYEAIGKGVVKRPYSLQEHHYAKEWKIPLSPEKESEVQRYLDSLVGKKYEYLNFLWHIIRIWFGRWIGGKNDTFSCIELVNNALIAAGLPVSSYDSPYETQTLLERLYGGQEVKPFAKDWISQLLYWATPVMKLLATIIVIVLAIKGVLFVGVTVTHYF